MAYSYDEIINMSQEELNGAILQGIKNLTIVLHGSEKLTEEQWNRLNDFINDIGRLLEKYYPDFYKKVVHN